MKLTIITVVKNDKKNLLISLRSVFSQKLKNFEYIIYDGMSNDGTRSAIKHYLNKNVKYICKKDNNYYEGLNYAIKVATGDYIGILNAGDQYYDSQVLSKIFKKIYSTKCDILFGNLIYLNRKNRPTRVWRFPILKLNLISAIKIASPTLIIKRKILLDHPYDTSYSIASDTNFNIQISNKRYKFIYLDIFLILMRTGGLSTNHLTFLKKMREDLIILRKHFRFIFIFIYIYKIFLKLKTFNLNKFFL
jgi:glycosyltransferase involved in cell wall biosynthesis